jgi:hypothetical protein
MRFSRDIRLLSDRDELPPHTARRVLGMAHQETLQPALLAIEREP